MSPYPIPDAVLAHHTAVLGKTGSGKSSTGKLMIEHVVDQGFRVCILDPIKSDWWGMIGEGSSAGLPFRILGGPHGHVPLPSSAGEAVGKLVASGQLPLSIIDMADFEMGGIQKFFVDFAEALMRSQKGVLYLVMEEAHEFAPKERAGIGGESMAMHWAKKLAIAGRSKGIRLIVATQRVQSLHNAVLGSCETLIAHRLTTPADQDPVLKWIKANVPSKEIQREVAESLASLPTGTGWLCSGEAQIFERVQFPKFRTFDNAATPIADDEEIAVKTAKVDTEALRLIIGAAVEEAEENDPRALKAKIAKLEQQVAKGRGAAPEWPDQREEVAQLRRLGDTLYRRGIVIGIHRAMDAIKAIQTDDGETPPVDAETVAAALQETPEAQPVASEPWRDNRGRTIEEAYLLPERLRPKRETRAPREGPHPLAEKLAARMAAMAPARLTWRQLASIEGYKPDGGYFRAAKRDALDRGILVEDGDYVSSAATAGRPLTRDQAFDLWHGILPQPAPRIMEVLRDEGLMFNGRLAASLGYSPEGGFFRRGVSLLRQNGVIVEVGRNDLQLADPLPGQAS